MAAPAHYLASKAEENAKQYAYEWAQALLKRIKSLEERLKLLEDDGNEVPVSG